MISRRNFIILGCGVATGAQAQLPPNIAEIRQAALKEAIGKVVGNAPLRRGRVKIDIPPLIDNGNAVPLAVEVDSPMSAADHVKAIHIFTEKNPQPYVASFHIGPRAGKANLSTRIRLADTQQVVAVAEMSDGSFWTESADVVVTLAACIEGES